MNGGRYTGRCSVYSLNEFSKSVKWQLLKVNTLLVVDTMLTAVMVAIGAYGRRYRHHPATRLLFQSATVLFLPIVSHVVTTINNQYSIMVFASKWEYAAGECQMGYLFLLVIIWSGLIQIVAINTTAIVVASDARERRTVGPPVVLIVQAIWTSYLALISLQTTNTSGNSYGYFSWSIESVFGTKGFLILPLFAIIFAKLLLQYSAWYMARKSLALGRIPRLIVGYMEQIQDGNQHKAELTIGEHIHIPPPLIVMGEENIFVETQPHGYTTSNGIDISIRTSNKSLVTMDRIWQLNDMLIQRSRPTTRLKDLCLSFALFKLLRCRFARYTIVEAGFIKACDFLWHMLLEDCNDERIFVVIEYELSFLHDYYYSSFPISYSRSWLPFLSMFISLLSISYCLLLSLTYIISVATVLRFKFANQLLCKVQCTSRVTDDSNRFHHEPGSDQTNFGSMLLVFLMLLLLYALVMLAEAREIASYVCCNWTKVSLLCLYVNNASWKHSPIMQKCLGLIFQCRCNLFKHWEGKMNQCSILVLRPRKTPLALLRCLLAMPDKKTVVPKAVKAAILHALRSYDVRSRSNNVVSPPSNLRVGDKLVWEFNVTKGTTHTMLVCHIATSILDVRKRSEPSQPLSNHKIVANHLSRYCAYLVAHCPDLLPDDDYWCKSLYKAVKKDADRVQITSIAVSTPEEEYRQLVELLGTRSKHEVLMNGVELGKKLVDMAEGEEAAWRVLASFWSEMILYIAPSENVDGHAEAIARGGELITLVWALLAHLGIVRRADDTATSANANANAPGAV